MEPPGWQVVGFLCEKLHVIDVFKRSPPIAAYMRQLIGLALV